jgi:hypothetical protein
MSQAIPITDLYALLDEQSAATAHSVCDPVPQARWRPAAPNGSGMAGGPLCNASGRASLAVHQGADASARSDPAPGLEQGYLGSAVAGPVWAWADPAAPSRFPTAGVAVLPLFPRQLPAHAAPAPRPQPPAAAPASAAVPSAVAPTELRMPPDVLRAMAAAAAASGRSETEIWAEAAREWLRRHTGDDDPQPPDPAASARPPAAPRTPRDQCWTAIDILLGDLRATTPARRALPEPIRLDPAA